MRSDIYLYQFDLDIPVEEIEDSILIALLAAEALYGECEVQLAAPHYFDAGRRTCVVNAATETGNVFNRVLLGFLRREFGTQAFRVESVVAPIKNPADAA